jgi:hypothetical protein
MKYPETFKINYDKHEDIGEAIALKINEHGIMLYELSREIERLKYASEIKSFREFLAKKRSADAEDKPIAKPIERFVFTNQCFFCDESSATDGDGDDRLCNRTGRLVDIHGRNKCCHFVHFIFRGTW